MEMLLTVEDELVKSSLVPGIPTVNELYEEIHGQPPSGPGWDAILTMIKIDQTMQHVFLGPPRMDPEAAATFRAAIAPAMASAAFAAEATRILSYVPDAVGQERAMQILDATADVTPEVQAFIKAQIARNNAY